MASRPMEGVRILEVAQFTFTPSAGAVLADWGADVVKVERPTGDPLRHIMGAGFVAGIIRAIGDLRSPRTER